jgi:hypothetical protein
LTSFIGFNSAQLLDQKFHARFAMCDKSNICDGVELKPPFQCSGDPSRNTVFLKLADGTIFYDAKMAIDADGSWLSMAHKGTNQGNTSLRYPLPNKPSLDADRVPYIVIPYPDLRELRIETGDIAAVVWRDYLVYAIVGDYGPPCKLGEGSIELHERLGYEACKERDSNGACTSTAPSGIEANVLYFIFPGSRSKVMDGLAPENINDRIVTEGQKLIEGLRGAYVGNGRSSTTSEKK